MSILNMWYQTNRLLYRHPIVGELLSKLLQNCHATIPLYPVYFPATKWIHSTCQLRRWQKITHIKTTSKGRRNIAVEPSAFSFETQSVILPGPEKIRASIVTDTPEKLLEFPDAETQTVYDLLIQGYLKTQSGKCLGTRSLAKSPEYEWISYEEVMERVGNIGSGLVNLGLEPSQNSFVGICTKTRPEFILTMLGTSRYSMILVPMYECLGIDIISFIVNQVQLKVIICEDLKVASLVIQNREKYPNLKYVVLIDDTEEIEEIKTSSIKVMTFKELEDLGKSNSQIPKKPKPDDMVCICYTSGTTGQPKGVMISHRNVLSTLASMNVILGEAVSKSGTIYAYLPCAHIYEIVNETFALFNGGQIGFYSGNTENILEDISYLKPNVLPLVPKLMNRIYSGVKNKVGPNIFKRYLFKLALHQKEKYLKRGIISKDTIWDYLMFHDIHKVMGGVVELLFTASAPVSKEVMKFFRCASGCLVFEVYGLSEVGAATMTLLSEHDSGFVGPPLPSNHIKLVSVPELFYDANDDVGEICIRGPNVFLGYYKNSEDTKKAIDSEGWHYTGDIGKWLPNGTLCIIDRKKHIFKLSQGEYIVPEKSENLYVQSHIISQVFVDGQVEQDYPVAIVVPEESTFIKWAREKGFKDLGFEDLCKNVNVRKALLDHMLKTGKRKNLNSLQQIGNVYISSEPFTQENDLLTPTMKLKRVEARKRFEVVINQLYEEGNMRKMHNL